MRYVVKDRQTRYSRKNPSRVGIHQPTRSLCLRTASGVWRVIVGKDYFKEKEGAVVDFLNVTPLLVNSEVVIMA